MGLMWHCTLCSLYSISQLPNDSSGQEEGKKQCKISRETEAGTNEMRTRMVWFSHHKSLLEFVL